MEESVGVFMCNSWDSRRSLVLFFAVRKQGKHDRKQVFVGHHGACGEGAGGVVEGEIRPSLPSM